MMIRRVAVAPINRPTRDTPATQTPRLLHAALQPRAASQERALEALLHEQRQTNGLLRLIIAGALGVLLGLGAAVLFLHRA